MTKLETVEALSQAATLLDETIRDAEDWLIGANAWCEAQVPLSDQDYLALRRQRGGPQLMYGTLPTSPGGEPNERPLIDVSRVRKVRALMALDRLAEAMQANSEELLVKMDQAILFAMRVMGKPHPLSKETT